MTVEQIKTCLKILRVAYPNFYKGMTKKEGEEVIELWACMFREDDPEIVAAAVKALIATDTRGFPPPIGAIKDKMRKISEPKKMTEIEAWGLVLKAIKNGKYGSREEFERLPPDIQRLVGSPNQLRDWAMMDSDSVQSVVASNFQRSYRERKAENLEFLAWPKEVQELSSSLSKSLELPQEKKELPPSKEDAIRKLMEYRAQERRELENGSGRAHE